MKKIVLTGGGTAGHVTPNIALVPKLKESGFEIKYIGTYLLKMPVLTISVFLQVSFAVILAGRIFLILSVF